MLPTSIVKVTIIIAVYNGEKFLRETIQSIINQTYKNIELIIIDGGSKDNTLDIIEDYRSHISYFISEKDSGISDAFNKGIRASTGDYISFQGDGDGFIEPTSIESVMKYVNYKTDILVSCRIARLTENGDLIYKSKARKLFFKQSLIFKMSLPHQGLFTHRCFFESYGEFDLKNKFCMDYEILLRAYKKFPSVKLINIVVAKWRADGLGNNKELEIFKEYDNIKRIHKIAPSWFLYFVNSWTIFKFRLKKLYGI